MKAKRKYPFEPDTAVRPGETLCEIMDYWGLTARTVGLIMCPYPKTVGGTDLRWSVYYAERITGIMSLDPEHEITPTMAIGIAVATGTEWNFWLNLQHQYDDARERIGEYNDRSKDKMF